MKKLRIALIVLAALLLAFAFVWFAPSPDPPVLYAHYETAEGPQTRHGALSGLNFGNWLVKQCMNVWSLDPNSFGNPHYDDRTITAPAGTMLRFTNQAENGRRRYRMGGATIDFLGLEDCLAQHGYGVNDIQECEVLNKYEFQYAAPEIPGQYVIWLDVDFRSHGSAHYVIFLDAK